MIDIRETATALYGPDHPDQHYIDHLAEALRMSRDGVRKWWYGQRQMPGPAETALTLMLEKVENGKETQESS